MTKGGISLTIDKQYLDPFNEHAEREHINRSSLVEEWIKDYCMQKGLINDEPAGNPEEPAGKPRFNQAGEEITETSNIP